MSELYVSLLRAALAVLALLLFCCIVRAFRGPKVADRLVAINMMTTLTIIAVCILAFLLREGYLADVALLFSLLGFLAAVVLTRVFLSRKQKNPSGKGVSSRVE